MAESTLQRPMFSGQSSNVLGPTVGIRTAKTATDTANELRNMFAPTVSMGRPTPVQSFRGGGEVINGVKHFQGGGINLIEDMSGIGGGGAAYPGGAAEVVAPPAPEGSSFNPLNALRDTFLRSRGVGPAPVFPESPPEPPIRPGSVQSLGDLVDVGPSPGANFPMDQGPSSAAPAAAAASTSARPKGALELTLEGIRAERAKMADDKKQNALLALMQAGFAMAAGRSPSAIANIGAGGQAGIAAFAGLEKERRADEASLRREETAIMLERERMRAQEERAPEAIRTYAALGGWDPSMGREGFNEAVRRGIEVTKTLEKDPEQVRFLKALGGGDLMRGFEIFNKDKNVSAAQTILKDTFASEDEKKTARTYLNNVMTRSMTSGGGGFEGFSATPVR